MKRFLGPLSLIAAVAVAAVYVGTAVGSSINFTASYKGHVTEVVKGTDVTATPKGKGTATKIGKGTLAGTVAASTDSTTGCSPLSGPGTLKGKHGTLKLKLLPKVSTGCAASQDDQKHITFSGKAKVTGGTGALKKASGTLNFLGHYNRGTGAFDVKLVGTLKH